MIPWLTHDTPFPPVGRALRSPNGLLAAGGALSASRLLEAYRHGIFRGSTRRTDIVVEPDPRMVLIPGEFKISRSLAKVLRNADHKVRTDTAFERVMRACAAPARKHQGGGTWISEDMIAAYCELHQLGLRALGGNLDRRQSCRRAVRRQHRAHVLRRIHVQPRQQRFKIALAHLASQLERWRFGMIDSR